MQLYMGMLGHAAFVRRRSLRCSPTSIRPDRCPWRRCALTQPDNPHAGHTMPMDETALPAAVSFPYGFPTPGDYRIFVQVKRGGTIETGVFDAQVVK